MILGAASIAEKIPFLWPEIAAFLATCVVMVVGLSPNLGTRRLCAPIAGLGLVAAGVLAAFTTPEGTGPLPFLMPFAKVVLCGVGLVLLLLASGVVDRDEEAVIAAGKATFNPLRTNRAEFYAFFLFSLTGLMLCASADDLIWLFLALELTSLPTYIMVTMSRTGRDGARSCEAGVKYFFLGALGAAMFLYGFALLYGGTGTTSLRGIERAFVSQSGSGGINSIAMVGMLLSIVGVGFKIAAVPMHLYTPDVYEGSASPVAAFLAFVPKTAGFLAIILLVSTMGWTFARDGSAAGGHSLPQLVLLTLWVMAALTMTVGNVLALLQKSVRRILAYSSIAHSGYMLVGVIAGPGDGTSITRNGIAAVLFYLLCYGLMNVGAFAVLACLDRKAGDDSPELETVDDLRGLCSSHPVLGWTMVVCALGLMGFPPLLGFFAKVPLFTSAIAAGEIPLVIVLGLNSAIAAFYYLQLVAAPMLEAPDTTVRTEPTGHAARPMAALISAASVVGVAVASGPLMEAGAKAGGKPVAKKPAEQPKRPPSGPSGH
ncbi:MAG: NADH-quinone oxidoreductase subunit N [Phycisphaerae bacterium]|nr:NADH-quinone oxidoreductase subunit N [Phycisphaerae bacterium]